MTPLQSTVNFLQANFDAAQRAGDEDDVMLYLRLIVTTLRQAIDNKSSDPIANQLTLRSWKETLNIYLVDKAAALGDLSDDELDRLEEQLAASLDDDVDSQAHAQACQPTPEPTCQPKPRSFTSYTWVGPDYASRDQAAQQANEVAQAQVDGIIDSGVQTIVEIVVTDDHWNNLNKKVPASTCQVISYRPFVVFLKPGHH